MLLEPNHEQVLRAVIALCARTGGDHVSVSRAGHEEVLSQLRWEDGVPRLLAASQELRDLSLLRIPTLVGGTYVSIEPTMAGMIRATRRGYVFESRRIDMLVAEWETTGVDFKREVHTDSKGEKAELIKDLIALANTQASVPRLLVRGLRIDLRPVNVGFDEQASVVNSQRHKSAAVAKAAKTMNHFIITLGVFDGVEFPGQLLDSGACGAEKYL